MLHKRVMVGDDGSPGADLAWGWVTAHRWPGWVIDVVTVVPLTPESYQHEVESFDLHEWSPPQPREAPSECEIERLTNLTVESDPRVVFSGYQEIDLVVLGQRGKGLLKAMRLGSTVEWLMRCPGAPLLIAKTKTRTEKLLVCVDGSPHADAVVALLAAMPWIKGTEATVLGIVEAEDGIREKVAAAGQLLATAGADVTEVLAEQDPLVLTVSPRMTINDYLESEKPDLVAMGTRGMTGFSRLWVGSVASAIAHHAKCSVLMAHDASFD